MLNGLLEKGRVNVGFIDGQWGSSGKGKFNGTLALGGEIDFAISQNSVNASHIVVWNDPTTGNEREYKFQHLPTSVINPKVKAILGAGASIDMKQLLKEIADWDMYGRLFIHPNAVVITQDDIDYEKEHLQRIASTMTGNGAAAARKVMRHPNTRTASDFPELAPFVCDTYEKMYSWLAHGQTGILETAQGFDLSMDHGMVFHNQDGSLHKAYPYCTSRNVDPLTFAGMSGVCKGVLGKTFLNLRALPIKVGDGSNTKVDGYSGVNMAGSNSGPCWPDQDELSWPDVTAIAGSLTPLLEQTSLTKRTRRIFSFSLMQLQHITKIVQPDFITINFMNYMDHSISGKHGVMGLVDLETQHPRVASMVYMVNEMQYWANTSLAGQVVAIGTGPHDSDIIRLV